MQYKQPDNYEDMRIYGQMQPVNKVFCSRLFKSVTSKSPTAYRAELNKRLALTV